MRVRRLLILAFLLPTGVSAAQTYPNDGVTRSGWFSYIGDHTFARKPEEGRWGLHLEGQLRRSPFIANSQQLLLRPGLFRKVTESQRITVGYTYVRNSPPANSATILGVEPRHTAYAQYDRDDKLGRIKLKQSARLENRFAGSRREHIDLRYSFRQRVRYRLEAKVEGSAPNGPLPDFYKAYNEVAFRIAPKDELTVLNQNRTYGGLGWRIAEKTNLEFGYMFQYRPLSNGIVAEQNHSIQFTISSDKSLRDLFR